MTAHRPSTRLIAAAACSLAFVLAAGPLAAREKHSGFLNDYSGLEKEKDPLGRTRRIWLSPRLTAADYPKVLLEPMVFHPRPQGNVQVPDEVLERMIAYVDGILRTSIGAAIPLAGEPGPGVVRARAAITGVGVDKGLKPHEYIPIALIAAGVKEAAGVRKHKVDLFLEAELTDSVTGEMLGRVVRKTPGLTFTERKNVITFEDVKPIADGWGDALRG